MGQNALFLYISTDNFANQRFDTVDWVVQSVHIVPEMTYYVSGGMLNHTHSLTLTHSTA